MFRTNPRIKSTKVGVIGADGFRFLAFSETVLRFLASKITVLQFFLNGLQIFSVNFIGKNSANFHHFQLI